MFLVAIFAAVQINPVDRSGFAASTSTVRVTVLQSEAIGSESWERTREQKTERVIVLPDKSLARLLLIEFQ
jgi:hypothetical protein